MRDAPRHALPACRQIAVGERAQNDVVALHERFVTAVRRHRQIAYHAPGARTRRLARIAPAFARVGLAEAATRRRAVDPDADRAAAVEVVEIGERQAPAFVASAERLAQRLCDARRS